jgi:hypothetical protein
MITTFSRKLARVALITGGAFAATLLLVEPGWAEIGMPDGGVGSRSFGQIASGCGSSGGSFEVSTDGGYGCKSKDGKSHVTCGSNGVCTCSGNCTDLKKGGLKSVLGPPSSAGTASSIGGTATKHRLPVERVGGPKVSGGATSGGTHPVVLQRSAGHSGGSRH